MAINPHRNGVGTAGGELLTPALLGRLHEHGAAIRVSAGQWLFREDDPADSAYVVQSGRLEVLSGRDDPQPIRTLKRGAVIGELALLMRARRSASVRAVRDSELLEIGRSAFDELLAGDHELAVTLCGILACQVAANQSPPATREPPRTVAIVALDDDVTAHDVAVRLARALTSYGKAAVLTGGDGLAAIERAEVDSRWVILAAAADPSDSWTQLCLAEADRIVALSTGNLSRSRLHDPAALRGCELLVLGGAAPDSLLRSVAPDVVQVLADEAAIERALSMAARRLTGRAVGIVLSGGGARAFAHIGVVEELRAAGVQIDRFGGTSMGAAVAGVFAQEPTDEEAYAVFHRAFMEERSPSRDYTLPVHSLLHGRRTRQMLANAFGTARIEQLPTRFFCVSADLVARSLIVHRTGPLHEAVFSSLAIPGVFPPVPTADGGLLVDGAVLDNLPVETMAADAEGPVIAVDVTQAADWAPKPGERGWRATARSLITGSSAEVPTLGETMLRTLTVGSRDTVAAARRHADLVITPDVSSMGLLDWKQLPRMRAAGRDAVRRLLESDPDALAALTLGSGSS